jgi:pimeloyl-ACP methyl ester carboxylesterase
LIPNLISLKGNDFIGLMVRFRLTTLPRAFVRFAIISGVLCLLFFVVLPVWNIAAEARWSAQHPVPGDFYSIEGKRMHLVCTGAGLPTVVLEAAAGARGLQWRKVQPALSTITRVCSYDRAGHGWSEPRNGARDAESIVRELHMLLERARVSKPFVYVGESAGGLYIREYAREYPAELQAVALIESSSPLQIDELPGFRASWENDTRAFQRKVWIDRLRVWSGWERLLGTCTDSVDCRPAYVDMDENELPYFGISSQQAGRLKNFGQIPLLIMTKDTAKSPITAEDTVWEREQEASKSLSDRSWRVIARGSGHIVPIDRPDIVISELTQLIDYLRGGPAPAFGTTTTK